MLETAGRAQVVTLAGGGTAVRGRGACHLVFSIMLATSSARQADASREQLLSLVGEQAQRGLSLAAVFAGNRS
jgi:hypothetical protein